MNTEVWLTRFITLHMVLSLFGAIAGISYNPALFALGFWAVYHDRSEAMGIFVLFTAFSILCDIVWMGVFGEDIIDGDLYADGTIKSTARFSLAMDIVSLIFKPVTLYLAYRFFTEKGGTVPTGGDGGYQGGDAGVTYQTSGYQDSGYQQGGDAPTI